MKLLAIYLTGINIMGFLAMYSDKQRAIHRYWRTPERRLFLRAAIGGSLGCILGMCFFRHKTKHWAFVLGMPLILIVQLVIAFFLTN